MKPSKHTVDIQKCEKQIGNKFDMVLVAAARTRELHRGRAPLLATNSLGCVTSLMEIEAGLVGRDMLRRIAPQKRSR